jgi:hypothetical protein
MTSGNSIYCWRILLISSLVFFLVDFGFYLTVPAQTKIFEDIICRQYEAEGDCKVALVQSELAAVNGVEGYIRCFTGYSSLNSLRRAGRPRRTEAMFIAGSPRGNSGRNLGSYRVYVSPSLVLCLD